MGVGGRADSGLSGRRGPRIRSVMAAIASMMTCSLRDDP